MSGRGRDSEINALISPQCTLVCKTVTDVWKFHWSLASFRPELVSLETFTKSSPMLIHLTTTQEIILFLFSELSLARNLFNKVLCLWMEIWLAGVCSFCSNCVACQKTERVDSTEDKVWIGRFNVKAWKTIEHILPKNFGKTSTSLNLTISGDNGFETVTKSPITLVTS